MRWMLCVILFLTTSAFGAESLPASHHLLWWNCSVTYMHIQTTEQIAPSKYSHTGSIKHMTYPEAKHFVFADWIKPSGRSFNLHDFKFLSQNWPGHDVPVAEPVVETIAAEPNEPASIITFYIAATTKEGGVFHLSTCRYVKKETAKPITPKQSLLFRPCDVCGPYMIENLLKEFLPEVKE